MGENETLMYTTCKDCGKMILDCNDRLCDSCRDLHHYNKSTKYSLDYFYNNPAEFSQGKVYWDGHTYNTLRDCIAGVWRRGGAKAIKELHYVWAVMELTRGVDIPEILSRCIESTVTVASPKLADGLKEMDNYLTHWNEKYGDKYYEPNYSRSIPLNPTQKAELLAECNILCAIRRIKWGVSNDCDLDNLYGSFEVSLDATDSEIDARIREELLKRISIVKEEYKMDGCDCNDKP